MAATADPALVSEILLHGLERLRIAVSAKQLDGLMAYLSLLSRWNRAYNLTAVRDPRDMVHRHILDSLAILPLLPDGAQRVIDVGTGAGLPGVPLALLSRDRSFDLLDSNGKKTRFLFQVKTELGLSNMTVCHARVEAWRPTTGYDVVLSRAFASLAEMTAACAHLLRPDGLFLAMKGQLPEQEMGALPTSVRVNSVHRLDIPGLAEERHVVELQPHAEPKDEERR